MRNLRMTTRRWMIVVAVVAVADNSIALDRRRRESVRRRECVGNLKMVGLALANYHSAYGSFPPATVGNINLPPDRRLSWTVVLFLYFAQGLSLIVDHKEPWDSPANLRRSIVIGAHSTTVLSTRHPRWIVLATSSNARRTRCRQHRAHRHPQHSWESQDSAQTP